MAVKRATNAGKKVKELPTRTLHPNAARTVKGGRENTNHPPKVTVPDLK